MKDFEKNYLEYTDGGVLVKYIGKNGIDIDDYIQSLLDKRDEYLLKIIEQERWEDRNTKEQSLTRLEEDITNNLNI